MDIVVADLTPEVVRYAYRLMLGREPESEAAVQDGLSYRTIEALRAAFLSSDEFRGVRGGTTPDAKPGQPQPVADPMRLVPVGAPPIEVEWRAGPEIGRLLADVTTTWSRLGVECPHWSVLSSDEFLPDRIADSEDSFFASGQHDVTDLVGVLARHGKAPRSFPRMVEFGCGMGRVTPHLARCFPHVTACDVSASHLALARGIVAQAGLVNVTLAPVVDDLFGMDDGFDLWFSRLVLQHNPPPVIAQILERAFVLLEPGGMAVFQVPTYALGYQFRLQPYLARDRSSDGVEMHVLPQPAVLAIARDCGCRPLEVIEDGSAGPIQAWRSTTFVMQKPA